MSDGRNGGGRKPKPIREIPFSAIDAEFHLMPLFNCPAVHRQVPSTPGGYTYSIRVWAGETRSRDGSLRTKYDYFYLDEDGTVTSAPRGYAKDYRPARITGMDEALAKYGDPS